MATMTRGEAWRRVAPTLGRFTRANGAICEMWGGVSVAGASNSHGERGPRQSFLVLGLHSLYRSSGMET